MLDKTRETTKIVPYSGIQFLVYDFDIDKTPPFSRSFIEHRSTPAGSGNTDGTVAVELRPGWNDDYPDSDPPFKATGSDNQYDISKQRALEPFLNPWVPLPFLAVQPGRDALGRNLLHQGPTNLWPVKVTVGEQGAPAGVSHRIVFAFDTELVERRPNRAYVGPSPQ